MVISLQEQRMEVKSLVLRDVYDVACTSMIPFLTKKMCQIDKIPSYALSLASVNRVTDAPMLTSELVIDRCRMHESKLMNI